MASIWWKISLRNKNLFFFNRIQENTVCFYLTLCISKNSMFIVEMQFYRIANLPLIVVIKIKGKFDYRMSICIE